MYARISQDCRLALDEAQELFGSSFTWNAAFHYGQSDVQQHDAVASEIRGRIMSTYSALRMLCDHPQLLMDSALEFEADNGTGSGYCWELLRDPTVSLMAHQKSPKLESLMEYVKDAVEADPDVKIVVFATFTRLFPYVVEAMEKAKIGVVQFHGGMSATAKHQAKLQFQNDKDIRVFLSSDAGGYGVDLPQASILVNYNLPWSAGTALQRNSRIIRASSGHKQVRIERLLMEKSVEVRQWDMLGFKMSVSGGIVDGVVSDPSGNIENTVEGLRNFLLSDS
jgi:SNF2 family DNA or RNA helicase